MENEKLQKYLSKGDILEVNPIQKIPRIKRPKHYIQIIKNIHTFYLPSLRSVLPVKDQVFPLSFIAAQA